MNHRWEYLCKRYRDGSAGVNWKDDRKALDRKLAENGADGWELISAYQADIPGMGVFLFKRRIPIARQVVSP